MPVRADTGRAVQDLLPSSIDRLCKSFGGAAETFGFARFHGFVATSFRATLNDITKLDGGCNAFTAVSS